MSSADDHGARNFARPIQDDDEKEPNKTNAEDDRPAGDNIDTETFLELEKAERAPRPDVLEIWGGQGHTDGV